MNFSQIIGQDTIVEKLLNNIKEDRISHAQLFVGKEGSGKLATALALATALVKTDSNKLLCSKYMHPDIHFLYPTANTLEVKSKAQSIDFIDKWRSFIGETPYQTEQQWYSEIGIENKQGRIGVDDAQRILKILSLKSYEAAYKVCIIWQADKMNVSASNKLLKLLEEPPERTLFILITEKEEDLLQTILSRTQILRFKPIATEVIVNELIADKGVSEQEAKIIASQVNGNYSEAIRRIDTNPNSEFEAYFVDWIRYAFMAKTKPIVLQKIIALSEAISGWGRERQKKYIEFCLEIFRQSLVCNYQAKELNFLKLNVENFNWEKFTTFIHGNNIIDIIEELNNAHYHIERNGNPKLIFLDLSIKTTRYIHRKA